MSALKLRNFRDEDIIIFKIWLNMPHVAKWYHDPLDWVYEVSNRSDEFSFLHHYIVELEGKPIGFCQYYEYCHSGENWHGDTDIIGAYSIDYLIGCAEYIGKGHGKGIVRLLIHEIELEENAKRIIVQPEQENRASCNTLLSSGFVFDTSNQIYHMELNSYSKH